MKRVLVCLVLLFILVGCAQPPSDKEQSNNQDTNGILVYTEALDTVYRFVDNDAGVVCWIYNGYQKGGISCLPIYETSLSDETDR